MIHKNKSWNEKEKDRITIRNNWYVKDIRKLLNEIDTDPKKEKRTQRHICKLCFYKTVISMQAFTDTQCGKCDKKMTFSNSDVNLLCDDCAEDSNSCSHCGGEMN
ncbi:hypothetical protein D3C87_78720 [compost metagenome]